MPSSAQQPIYGTDFTKPLLFLADGSYSPARPPPRT
jgi:hypothetical protein